MNVPFFRPDLSEAEISEVVETLRSGWLTTGPRVKRFEEEFAAAVGAPHAVAVNSCTAALHLAVEALGLRQGQAVLVPTMTFAATAEIVRYTGALPVLVDCDPDTLNLDLADAERKLADLRAGRLPHAAGTAGTEVVGIIPVHVGGLMMDMDALAGFAERHGLWIVEDAAHAFPAAWRPIGDIAGWQRCGENTAAVSCFSFYANKTITTGEGGMATTSDPGLAERMRMMSLHGLSHDAWGRFSKGGSWDYKILAPGFKYNLTDIAAAIGIHQLARAEAMRASREGLAMRYLQALRNVEELDLPVVAKDRIHAWHLFPARIRLEKLAIDRNGFIAELKQASVGCSVHWRPLHLHPYYAETFGWKEEDLPTASAVWERIVTLPLFPTMTDAEHEYVVAIVKDICRRHGLAG
ncbi:MAG TPA: DegT/DnrJ/EryC1/StrS family aminotransferase [Thermoanaerobaculia bacterium]|nr:DegT/DnrJ/EryC1/StrS family aminotransferase [Thermoanaerobaculia bacterium]